MVGGRARYNHLDGEVQVLREIPSEQDYPEATVPEDLPQAGVWLLAAGPFSVPVQPCGSRQHWPNMWSLRHWKEKMERPVRRVAAVIEANGGYGACRCLLCPEMCISPEHLMGQKHYRELTARVPEGTVVRLDDFWQTWTFSTGAVAFNHVDGTLRMVRRPPSPEDGATDAAQTQQKKAATGEGSPQQQLAKAAEAGVGTTSAAPSRSSTSGWGAWASRSRQHHDHGDKDHWDKNGIA